MKIIQRAVGLAMAAGLVLTALAMVAPTAEAAAKPDFGPASPEYAPKGKKGAIVLPWTYCYTGTTKATIRKIGSTWTTTRSWKYGMPWVRVVLGKYRVTIKGCGSTGNRADTITVRREKDSNTITRSEFSRIKKGMTLAQVKNIVGTKGVQWGSDRLFDHAGSFGWAEVWLSKGKVKGKYWTAALGDSSVR